MKPTEWTNCYNDSWQGQIVPAAFAHPAKMAYGLLQRIYDHCFENGWLKEGDVVVDPFGGISSTAILGAYRGVQVITCELEPKFTNLAMQNVHLHLPKWRALGSPLPVIIQGDSRNLASLVGRVLGIESESEQNRDLEVEAPAPMRTSRQASCIIASPPYIETVKGSGAEAARKRIAEGRYHGLRPDVWTSAGNIAGSTYGDGYGHTPGQLGAMKPGSVDAVVGSPPFQQSDNRGAAEMPDDYFVRSSGKPFGEGKSIRGTLNSPGNLGNLKPGYVADCIVSSPPYEGSLNAEKSGIDWSKLNEGGTRKTEARDKYGNQYSTTPDNIGNQQGPTFWSVTKEIVAQCYEILRPGGHCIWVVKDFVRNGKRVDFTGDWQRLCEAAGFRTVCIHHAMLLKERDSLFADDWKIRKERASFFRDNCNKKAGHRKFWGTLAADEQQMWLEKAMASKGPEAKKHTILIEARKLAFEASKEDVYEWNDHIRIDYEVVICMQKAHGRAGKE